MKSIGLLMASALVMGCHQGGGDSPPMKSAAAPMYAPMGHPPAGAATQMRPAGVASTALAVGAKAPMLDASLPAHDLAVIVFYRGDWCPFCRAQLSDLQAHAAEFAARHAAIAAVSVDSAETDAHLAAGLHLGFTLVPDPGHALIEKFGVYDATNEISWPSVFIVDRSGAVAWRWLADDFKKRVTATELLGAIDGLAMAAH